MDRKTLLRRLNWFYSLEAQQYELYENQSRRSKDEYIGKVLNHISEVEHEHARQIANQIKYLGGKPTIMGQMLGPILGGMAGKLTSSVGTVNLFKINITLENKAFADYKGLVQQVKDEEIKKLLWKNAIEEDMHRTWFEHKKKELNAKKKEKKNKDKDKKMTEN